MGQIYSAQAFMSSKFPCNQQPQQKTHGINDNKISKTKRKSQSLSERVKTVAWSVIKVAMVTATAGARPVPDAVLEYLTNIIHSYVIDSIQKKDDPLKIVYFPLTGCSFGKEVAGLLFSDFKNS